MEFFTWISNNIFGVPAFLIGIIVIIGHLANRSSFSKLLMGTIKSIIGFLVLEAGTAVVVGALSTFAPMWGTAFGFNPASYEDSLAGSWASVAATTMFVAFIINLILARFTKFKYIYLTGHMMWWISYIFTGVAVTAAGPNVPFWATILILSPLIGIYWTFQPALSQRYVTKIIKSNNFALGHTSGFGSSVIAYVGKLTPKAKKSSQIKIPDKLLFLKDNYVITALIMTFIFLIGSIIVQSMAWAGNANANAVIDSTKATSTGLSTPTNFIIIQILNAFKFTAGIAIVLLGVKLFVGELVPAFRGFAKKVVPNSIPALDCPVLFPFSQNALIFGFLGAFAAGMIWLIILGLGIGYVLVPTMIVLFFHGAIAGIFGDVHGGWIGALLSGALLATIVSLGQWLFVDYLGTQLSGTISWAADTDMFIFGPLIYGIFKLF